MNKFIYSASVNANSFENYCKIINTLQNIGYKFHTNLPDEYFENWHEDDYKDLKIVTNYIGCDYAMYITFNSDYISNKHYCENNIELFLALVSQTNKIKMGSIIKYNESLYKLSRYISQLNLYEIICLSTNIKYYISYLEKFTHATKEEIINFYTQNTMTLKNLIPSKHIVKTRDGKIFLFIGDRLDNAIYRIDINDYNPNLTHKKSSDLDIVEVGYTYENLSDSINNPIWIKNPTVKVDKDTMLKIIATYYNTDIKNIEVLI